MTYMRARTRLNFGLLGPLTAELAALERLKKYPYAYNGKNELSTFSRLFLIGSFSYLQVMVTYMRAWMSLLIGQIQPLVSMVTDRVMMGKRCFHVFSIVFHPFLFTLAGNDDMLESSDEFEFRPDWTPTAELAALERPKKSPYAYNEKNDVSTFSRLFMIGSCSYLQAMRTCIKAWMSSKFGQIRPLVCMATDSVII